jgi:hypothetical protein
MESRRSSGREEVSFPACRSWVILCPVDELRLAEKQYKGSATILLKEKMS